MTAMRPLHLPARIILLFLSFLSFSFSASAQEAISLDKVNYIALSPEAAACTKGQFDFIRKEIMLQRLGYGFFKNNSDISKNGNLINHALYQWYWEKVPGTTVRSF